MAKNKISEWSSTPANNTDVGGIDIAEGCAPSGINNAIREVMAQVKDMQAGLDGDDFTVGGNLTVTGTVSLSTDLPVAQGGTGASTASDARTNLGLGTISTQASNNVSITGGSVTGITDLAVADGGTGASTLTGVVIGNGTSAMTAVAPGTSGNVLTSDGTNWASAASSGIGVGQTWQDVTSSRALGTTYTNSTGKPIEINVNVDNLNPGTQIRINVNSVQIYGSTTSNVANLPSVVSGIIPVGASYSVISTGGGNLLNWVELR